MGLVRRTGVKVNNICPIFQKQVGLQQSSWRTGPENHGGINDRIRASHSLIIASRSELIRLILLADELNAFDLFIGLAHLPMKLLFTASSPCDWVTWKFTESSNCLYTCTTRKPDRYPCIQAIDYQGSCVICSHALIVVWFGCAALKVMRKCDCLSQLGQLN